MSVVSPPRVQSLASRLPHELRQTLASALGALDKHNQAVATSINSSPFARYTTWSPYTAASPLVVPASGNCGLPFALYYASVADSIANGTFSRVNFDTKLADTDNAVTAPTTTWNFTVPAGRGGVYQISAMATLAVPAGTAVQMVLALTAGSSGAIRFGQTNYTVTPTGFLGSGGSVTVFLNAGDVVNVALFQSSGAARSTLTGEVSTWVSINCLSLNSPYVPSCFPIDNLWQNQEPPSVVLAQAQDVTTPSSPSNLCMALADWVMVTQGGQQFVRIRNLPGLLPSTKYAVQVFAW